MRVVMGKLPRPQIIIIDWRLCSVAMSGKTTAPFRCPCTDAHATRYGWFLNTFSVYTFVDATPTPRKLPALRGKNWGIANRSTSFVKVTNTTNYIF